MNGPGAVLVTGGASGPGAAVVEAVRPAGDHSVPYVPVDLGDSRAAERATRALADRVAERVESSYA